MLNASPQVVITYFRADDKKDGGEYINAGGAIKTIDDYTGAIVLTSGEKISFGDILNIESKLFDKLL